MDLRFLSPYLAAAFCLVLISNQVSTSTASVASQDFSSSFPEAIKDLKDATVKGLGFQSDDFKISGFDLRDAQVGKSVVYNFVVQSGNKVMPYKLVEGVNRWEHADLPIFRTEHSVRPGDECGLVYRRKVDDHMPVLPPFQLAGPMELWIQDANDMRISLPHDVDAGVLKKLILGDGAVVTVKGAKSVKLRHAVELPLPINRTDNGFASGLLSLSGNLLNAARTHNGPLVSLQIVGLTSLTSPASSSPSSKLKLKLLAPGLVELSSAAKRKSMEADAPPAVGEPEALLATDLFSKFWPITSIDGSNSNLLGLETLLSSLLGPSANKEGSFKLLKADVSAQTFVKTGFRVEKKIREDDEFFLEGFPEWRTKPQTVTMHFEVLAKVDRNKIVPEKVLQVDPVIEEDSVTPNLLMRNITMSSIPIVYQPISPFTL